jgi:hypothetical protein
MENKSKTADARWKVGQELLYIATGEKVQVLKIHHDDDPPYYTVIMADGREKQTTFEKMREVDTKPLGVQQPVCKPSAIITTGLREYARPKYYDRNFRMEDAAGCQAAFTNDEKEKNEKIVRLQDINQTSTAKQLMLERRQREKRKSENKMDFERARSKKDRTRKDMIAGLCKGKLSCFHGGSECDTEKFDMQFPAEIMRKASNIRSEKKLERFLEKHIQLCTNIIPDSCRVHMAEFEQRDTRVWPCDADTSFNSQKRRKRGVRNT